VLEEVHCVELSDRDDALEQGLQDFAGDEPPGAEPVGEDPVGG
jgi:hypothetical protein